MTREEAIQWLKVINTKEFGWDEFALQESQREIRERCEQGVREAIDIAIEALSLANIKEEFESVNAEFTDLPDIPRYYYEKVVGNMAHEINMLKEQLESADVVEWIPCGERLPCEKDGQVLVTKSGEIMIAIYSEFNDTWYIGDMCAVGGENPTAWATLPKPYERQESEVEE